MPDPITSFGAAAGVVQIADVALRASREAYAFLIELKHAKRDIQDLKNALRDAESNVRSLRSYLYSFSKSKGAIEEFDILPEVVTSSIHLFHDDIVQLKSILPRKPTPSLAQKIKWVYNHKSVEEISKRLHERKSSLSVALSVVGR
ncbi:hypothetical protein B0J11DRAFT_448209 [Dendryphion nanum]|uniref:Fungal N-terminal domain-containing protein n=1 Tax=Dendryphion nanum TaxID=256645 RepID=A0A9P9I871_9PLEO|nr:hypothetical protein B0J11DRAFT_448209 [Dendryphion nanum]